MARKVSLVVCALFLFAAVAVPADAQRGRKKTIVDTKEYKQGEFAKGIIEDYSDMVEGDGVEWVYLAPGVKLSDYTIKITGWKNKSEVGAKSMMNALDESFKEQIDQRLGKGKKGTLLVDGGVYWAERASEGKRWIPYAGHHLAQAGIGVELVFRESNGNIVAKIRHSTREGNRLESAAEEVADDVVKFLEDN
jgi:hypothetical protein